MLRLSMDLVMEPDPPQAGPDYDEIADDLYELGTVISAAEFHGMTCGSLVGGAVVQGGSWQQQVFDFLGLAPDTEAAAPVQRVLALAGQVAEELRREDFGFELLLPPEDSPLQERATELANWCQGFLTGLALAGQDQGRWSRMPEDLAEGLADLASIAQLKVEDGDDEADYIELFEYVRVVVLNAYAELLLNDEGPVATPTHSASGLFGGDKKLH